jgi:hypothetical protein
MFDIEKDFQNLMEQVYGPLGEKKQMTEIEELKAQIKVLQSKLSFLEELEKTKSPVEEAFKDWMGVYPPTNPSVDNIFDIRWRAFQKGYDAAYEEKVSQEPEEQKWNAVRESVKWCEENPDKDPLDCLKPQKDDFMDRMVAELKGKTLEDIVTRWWCDTFSTHEKWSMEECIDDLIDQIHLWLPREQSAAGSQNAYVECSVEGFNDAIKKIKSKLRNKK